MNKTLLSVSLLAVTLISAQSNEALMQKFERQNSENTKKFEAFLEKNSEAYKRIGIDLESKKSFLAGFDPAGKPIFLEQTDLVQVKNANADNLQNGTINGLAGAFNGENIKYTVFDGGRAYEAHTLFNNLPNRIVNREAPTMNYNFHATAVTGFIGAKNFPATVTVNGGPQQNINFKGIAPNATFDNYSFSTTILPGNAAASSVYQKILIAQPKISNHSYGGEAGWSVVPTNIGNVLFWNGAYQNPGTSYDLQGTYMDFDQNYDEIVYENPSNIIVKAAGNSYAIGPDHPSLLGMNKYYTDAADNLIQFTAADAMPRTNCSFGYDCISYGSLAKNIIVVGATDIITANNNRYNVSSDVVHSDYSSAGPRDDGGIKPDISTTGTNVFHASTANNTTGSDSIGSGSGTSYSAPVVTGIIGLWMQIYQQLFPGTELNAASAKTLMVHSALEAGNVGPDPWFGWGYIDAKKGAELLVGKSNGTIIFNDETLSSGTPNKKTVKAAGTEPLKVTISWIDPAFTNHPTTFQDAHNNRSSKLINDLDLRIIDTTNNTVYMPWRLHAEHPMIPATKADNTVDNVEQVVFNTPVAGREYRIEITNKGNLVNNAGANAPQNYSIIVSGHSEEVLATGETIKANDIIIAPTVTKDFVKVLKAPKKSAYKVYDLSGKMIQTGTVDSDEVSLNFSSFSKGIYIIELKADKEVITKKIIKE